MSPTLKTNLTFSIIIVASFFILLGALYVQNLPMTVITPPPVATSTPIVWNYQLINSKDVSIIAISKISENPNAYEIYDEVSSSTPNTGSLTVPWVSINKEAIIEIGCIEGDEEYPELPCNALYVTPNGIAISTIN